MSTSLLGAAARSLRSGIKLCPPARALALGSSDRISTASSIEEART
jgi:hypothetical protein